LFFILREKKNAVKLHDRGFFASAGFSVYTQKGGQYFEKNETSLKKP
jgi:hypothetical protein